MSRWVVHPGQGDNPTSLYTHKSRTHLSTNPIKDTRHTELVVEPRYSSGFIFFKESAVKMPKQNCSKTPSNRVFHWDLEIYQPRNMPNLETGEANTFKKQGSLYYQPMQFTITISWGNSSKMINTSPQNGGPIFMTPMTPEKQRVSGGTLHLQDFHLQGLRWFLPQVDLDLVNQHSNRKFWLVVEQTHLKNMLVKLDHEAPSRGEKNKYLKPPVRNGPGLKMYRVPETNIACLGAWKKTFSNWLTLVERKNNPKSWSWIWWLCLEKRSKKKSSLNWWWNMAIFMPSGKNPFKIIAQIHFCLVFRGRAVKSYTIIIARDSSPYP